MRSLRLLLDERFRLKSHVQSKEGPIYALVVAKAGPKLKPSTTEGPPQILLRPRGHLSADRATIFQVAPFLSQEVGRKVINMTGLPGKYDFGLDWVPEQQISGNATEAPASVESSGVSIFTAVQEQLGLRLEPRKGEVEMLVVDDVEQPSEN
jgi:uncharacterized protein (TIGR03435 family)